MVHLRGCRREPGCHRQLPAARRAQAPDENLGNCKREITASLWDGQKEGSFPKLQLAGRLAGREKEKVLFCCLEVARNTCSAKVAMNMLLLLKILFYCILFPLLNIVRWYTGDLAVNSAIQVCLPTTLCVEWVEIFISCLLQPTVLFPQNQWAHKFLRELKPFVGNFCVLQLGPVELLDTIL